MKLTTTQLDWEWEPFVSPFPSYNTPQAIAFLREQAGKSSGSLAKRQAIGWQGALKRNVGAWLTSGEIGGAPIPMLRRMLPDSVLKGAYLPGAIGPVSENVDGLLVEVDFANIMASAVFGNTTDPSTLWLDTAEVGLSMALNVATPVPVVGDVMKAVVAVGKFFAKLAKKAKDDEEEAQRIVPCFSWDRDFEEDVVNWLSLDVFPTVDWTTIWTPPFEGNFDIRPTECGADTAAWGVFPNVSGPNVVAQPLYSGGLGLLPGMQQGVDVVQVSRIYAGQTGVRDAVTNAADFRPSANQQGTVAWSMLNDYGSPLMFQVQARYLAETWERWWDDYFEQGIDQLKSATGFRKEALAKALARWLCFKDHGWNIGLSPSFIETAGNLSSFIDKNIFSATKNKIKSGRQYYTPGHIIAKACDDLAQAQISALGRTTVCALVRPEELEDGNRPAFAAFEDSGPPVQFLKDKGYQHSTFGGQLRAYCNYVRDVLVDHPIKYNLSKRDVDAVDPAYSTKLGNLMGTPGQKLAAHPPGGMETEPPPAPSYPTGNPPFKWGEDREPRPPKETKWGGNVAVAALVIGGALAYKHRKELKVQGQRLIDRAKGLTDGRR